MEHSIYLDGLKKALKANGLTYHELAQSLNMTESGVKKMLNADDISLQRILQICQVIDVLPGQLLSLSEKASIPIFLPSDKQQEALIRDRHLLAAYWLFAIEKKTVPEIAQIQKTNATVIKSLLQRLVTLDLLSQKRNVFYAKMKGKFRWPDDSKLARALNHEWSHLTLQRTLKEKSSGFHRFSALKLTNESHTRFLDRLTQFLDEIAQTSQREELSHPSNQLYGYTFLIASAAGGVFDPE